jgi:hypothetical protein
MKKIPRRLAVLFLAALMLLTSGCKRTEPAPATSGNRNSLIVGYAEEGVTVVDDEDALQKAVDDMYESAKQQGMTLSYQNDAYSTDGVTFDCYIANHPSNAYDMFVAIYGDENYTDELYLSKLLRPGTAFDYIQLERKLDPGDYTVHLAYTQVETVDGVQSIHDQQLVSMQFHVIAN